MRLPSNYIYPIQNSLVLEKRSHVTNPAMLTMPETQVLEF